MSQVAMFDPRVGEIMVGLSEYFLRLAAPDGAENTEGLHRLLAALGYVAAAITQHAEDIEQARQLKEEFTVQFSVCCNTLFGRKFPGTAEAVANAAAPLIAAMKDDGLIR